MLILSATTDKIQLTTSAAATVDVHASFMDMTTADPPVVKGSTSGRQQTAITTATTTDIVAAPAASTLRNVKELLIRNKHATTSTDVTVVYDANGTDYELHKVTLLAGDALEYIEGIGWFTLSTTAGVLRPYKLTADQSNSTTTPTEVTGLSVTTGTGTFKFQYLIIYQSSVTTTGVKLSVNHSGTVTRFVANQSWGGIIAADATAGADQDQVLSTGAPVRVFAARAKSTAGWSATISVDTINADMLMIIDGLFVCTVDGDLELWHGSETANETKVMAGTSLTLTRTGD